MTTASATSRKRLGIDQCDTLLLGSPFDYQRQAKLVIPRTLPNPTEEALSLPRRGRWSSA